MDTLTIFYLALGIYVAAMVTHALTRVFAPPVQVINQIVHNVVATKEVLTHSKEVTLVSVEHECEASPHLYWEQRAHILRRNNAEMCDKLLHEMIRTGLIFIESREQRGYHGETIIRMRIGTYINHLSQDHHQSLPDPWSQDPLQQDPYGSGHPRKFSKFL